MSFRLSPLLCLSALGIFLHTPGCSPAVPVAGSGGSGPAGSGGVGVGGVPAAGGSSSGGMPGSGGAAPTGGAGGSSGGTPGSGGDVGSGGGTALMLVEPIERSATEFVLEFGDTKFAVDPTQGARVVTFSLAGTNLLSPLVETTDTPPALNGGSTFWLSPQAAWDWPPIGIDRDPYTATVTGSTIDLVGPSATIEDSTVHIEKSFSADLTAGAVDLVYEIHNEGVAVAPYAPWEVSRHDRGGLTFWPGAKAPDATARWEFEPTLIEGVYWWDDSASVATNVKVSSDGTLVSPELGWAAHVAGDLLFVKTWTPVAAADIALDHGEVELYLGDGYIELEVQGPLSDIPAAGSSTFAVRWTVRTLAQGTDVSVGSAALLAEVDAIVP